jgi:hypothetical protein
VAVPLQARRRKVFALLIENDTYDVSHFNLPAPALASDIELLATCFDGDTTVKQVKNAGGRELQGELEGFVADVRAAADAAADGLLPMVFVHYSGHGVEIDDDMVMVLRDFDGEPAKGLLSLHTAVGMFAPFASVLGTFDCCREPKEDLTAPIM